MWQWVSQAFAGIRVIDFTQVIAGPACTRVMAELGAEVHSMERLRQLALERRGGGDAGEGPAAAEGLRRGDAGSDEDAEEHGVLQILEEREPGHRDAENRVRRIDLRDLAEDDVELGSDPPAVLGVGHAVYGLVEADAHGVAHAPQQGRQSTHRLLEPPGEIIERDPIPVAREQR